MPRYYEAEILKSRFKNALTDFIHKSEIIMIIDDLPSVDTKEIIREEWISVKEGLPEEWKPVFGLIPVDEDRDPTGQIIDTMVYIGNIAGKDRWRVCWNHDMVESAVTHWMPLPELPKIKKED